MSFELHLEEQAAFAVTAVLDGWGVLEPTTEGERAALAAAGFSKVPVLTAGSNAALPKSASAFGVTVTEPEPVAEDDTMWVAELEILVRTFAASDGAVAGDPGEIGAEHRRRGRCVQKMMSPGGGKAEMLGLMNGTDDRAENSGVEFRVRVTGWQFVRYSHAVVEGHRGIAAVYDVAYSWAG